MTDLVGLASQQVGLPADACFRFFFLPLDYCVNIVSQDIGVLSILSLASKIAVFVGIGIAACLLIRKSRRSARRAQKIS